MPADRLRRLSGVWKCKVRSWLPKRVLALPDDAANVAPRLQTGFNYYKAGQWVEARAVFEQTYTMRRDRAGAVARDQPSKVLMDFMALSNFVAPGDWNGSRALTEK
jgi:hypothetical protein